MSILSKFTTNQQNKRIKFCIEKYFRHSGELIIDNGMASIMYSGCSTRKKYRLDELPINFYKVGGQFDCSSGNLVSLNGSPKYVGGNFNCSDNKLTSLLGAPLYVDGIFNCNYNKLTSLEGAPPHINGGFACRKNNFTSLNGIPKTINGDFLISVGPHTPLLKLLTISGVKSFNFYSEYMEGFEHMDAIDSPLSEINAIFNEYYRKIPNLTERIMKVGIELSTHGYKNNARL